MSLLVAGAAAAPAAASLSASQRISPSQLRIQQVDVAAGGGRTAVLLSGYDPKPDPDRFTLTARLGTPSGLGSPQTLATTSALGTVAVGADGTAVAVWNESRAGNREILRAAFARPGKGFGAARTLAQATRVAPGGVVVTRTGRAVVSWREGGGPVRVLLAVAAPGGAFGAPREIAGAEAAPALGVAADGTVVAAWLDTPPAPSPPPAPPPADRTAEVNAATLAPAATRFTRATTLDTLTYWPGSSPGVASGPGGAAIDWRPPGATKQLVSVLPGGVFAPAVATPPMPTIAGIGLSGVLALGLPSGGSIDALWQLARTRGAESSVLTSSVVQTSTLRPGGTFSPARTLSASGWLAGSPEAGALADRTVAAWAETANTRPSRLRLAVRRRGAWTTLTPRTTPVVDSGSVDLAAGRAHVPVVWIQRPDVRSPGGRAYLATYRP